jgi:hypothetical protein
VEQKRAAIQTNRRYNGHLKGREQAKFSKKKVTERSNGSDWHRRPPFQISDDCVSSTRLQLYTDYFEK